MNYQLRNRLHLFPSLKETDAGSYVYSLSFTEIELIQKSLHTSKRCGSDPPAPLIGFKWDATFSFANNWSTVHKTQTNLGHVTKDILHMPLCDSSGMNVIQSKLSLMVLFTACSGEKDGSTCKRLIAALENATRSFMLQVEESGIVDKPIAKFIRIQCTVSVEARADCFSTVEASAGMQVVCFAS